MPNGETAVVGAGQTERLAQYECGGTYGPRLIAPTLNLDLNLSTEIREGLIPNRVHDWVQEWCTKFRTFAANDEHLGIQ